jgi:hypothetical protein
VQHNLLRYLSPRRIWRFTKRESRAFSHAAKSRWFPRFFAGAGRPVRQKPLELTGNFGETSDCQGLCDFLSSNGISYSEGKHTIYVPPQDSFYRLTGMDAHRYPPDAGFKIVKRFVPLDRASYLIDGYRQPVARAMLGGLENQVAAAALLHELGLGPRIYDLTEIRASRFVTGCFVMQHISGEPPSYDEWSGFMDQMKPAIAHYAGGVVLVPPDGWNHADFAPPDCSGNLIRRTSDGRLFYIDFQQLAIVNQQAVVDSILEDSTGHFHFGGTRHVLGARRYLYQSIPGSGRIAKRDVSKRWEVFRAVLGNAGIALADRAMLDICCNAGMFLALGLADGARVGLGWDLPEVIAYTSKLQSILGNTRAWFFPAQMGSDYRLSADIPVWMRDSLQDSIVLYLAAWRHVGFIADMAVVPWRALIFEGHQDDTEEDTAANLRTMESLWGCRLASRTSIADGDSGARPLALLLRD